MRYRLIPTRGIPFKSSFVEGSAEHAMAVARADFDKTKIPVLVAEAPMGGGIRPLETVGGVQRKVKR